MRSNTAEAIERIATLEEAAVVVGVEPLRVRGGHVEYAARRAVSCLVTPRVDDEVLVSMLADGRAYVLAVLEREGSGVELEVEGDCAIAASGALSVAGAKGVALASGEDLDLVAGRVAVKSGSTSFATGTLEIVAESAGFDVERVRAAVQRFDGFFDRVIQRAKRSIRIVEEADQLRAGRIEQIAKDAVTTHGRDVVTTAEQLVKVDGGQIQIG